MPDSKLDAYGNSSAPNPAPDISSEPTDIWPAPFDFRMHEVPPPVLPSNWFWVADDGRVYASARQQVVKEGDAAYKAWVAAGYHPTKWPQDIKGKQTKEALLDVVKQHGLTVP